MIHIQPLRKEDRAAIHRLFLARKTFTPEEIDLAMELIDLTLEHPEKEEYSIYCAFLGEKKVLAGYICFGPIPITEGAYDLYWILVDKNLSRAGLGSELLLTMEEILIGKKARRIYIDTSSTAHFNAARSFYEKNGFRADAVLTDFYRIGDDKIIYVKEL